MVRKSMGERRGKRTTGSGCVTGPWEGLQGVSGPVTSIPRLYRTIGLNVSYEGVSRRVNSGFIGTQLPSHLQYLSLTLRVIHFIERSYLFGHDWGH